MTRTQLNIYIGLGVQTIGQVGRLWKMGKGRR